MSPDNGYPPASAEATGSLSDSVLPDSLDHCRATGQGIGKIAIVGTGPTGIYCFKHLQEAGNQDITLFERGGCAGIGMPYSPETADRSMLANIASIEIPPVVCSYHDWLTGQHQSRLVAYGMDTTELHDRQFTPRQLLGEYFRDQFRDLSRRSTAAGGTVETHVETEVTDVISAAEGLFLTTGDRATFGPFQRVIIATGHDFPDAADATRSYFPSPWSGLIQAEVPAARVGIMGTSLSSFDAAMAVASQHGRFVRPGGDLAFEPAGEGLHITLMSWTGVLPEADFWCPIPYEPLQVMTEHAVMACTESENVLDAAFELFRGELSLADPAYAARIGLSDLTPDSFAKAYFAPREGADPFHWARQNLAETEHNKAQQITVPWRYAILRMHERLELIFPALTEAERGRFDKGLKLVFVDNYAAVPAESIRRLLALRDAGVLSVLALGDDYVLDVQADRTVITAEGRTHTYDLFIDARGQKALTTEDLPFPTLRAAILSAGFDIPEVNSSYGLVGVPGYENRLVLAAIPYLMRDHPFVQGITASQDIGAAIARGLTTGRRRYRPMWM